MLIVVTIIACSITGMSIKLVNVDGVVALLIVLAAFVLYAQSRAPRIAPTVEAICQTFVIMAASAVLQYAAAVPALPYRDAWFAAADQTLGVDWSALHAWTWAHPFVEATQAGAYSLLIPQLFPALIVLTFLDREALRRFLTANFVVMIMTIAFSIVLPAAGAMAWYHPALTPITPESYPAQLELIRNGALRTIQMGHLVGLIQFPSYHAALAVLIGLAFSRTRWWIAAPVWLLEILIVASAPVMGGHHVIDVFAGTALALVVHALVTRYAQPPVPAGLSQAPLSRPAFLGVRPAPLRFIR